MPVQLPDLNPKRELARKLAESIVSQIPFIGGPYVAMLSVTHRPNAERKIAKWREDVTNVVNQIENATLDLMPTIKLSDDASALGLWFSKNSQQGRTSNVTFESIRAAFPKATKLELEDACGELQIEGLVTTSATIGHKVFLVRPTNLLFEIFDPIAIDGANPRIDAAHLAQLILKHDDGLSALKIQNEFNWTPRQLNPAMSILCEMVGPGRLSAEINPDFACTHMRPNSVERIRFKRYIEATLGEPQ
jgi:hypothetical protein